MTKRSLVVTTVLALLPAAGRAAGAGLEPEVSECRGPYTLKLERVRLDQLFSTLADLGKECSLRFEVPSELADRRVSVDLRDVKMSTVLDVLAGAHRLEYGVASDGGVHVRPAPPVPQPRLVIRPCADATGDGCMEIDGRRYRLTRTARVPRAGGGTLVSVRLRPEGAPAQ